MDQREKPPVLVFSSTGDLTSRAKKVPIPYRSNERPFVLVTPQNLEGKAAADRRTFVRQHVMRHYKHERATSHSTNVHPGGKQPRPLLPALTQRFRVHENPFSKRGNSKKANKKPGPKLAVDAFEYMAPDGWLSENIASEIIDPLSSFKRDPFISFPIEADADVHSLFYYYMKELDNNTLTVDPESDFVPIALSDAACFEMTMATVAQVQERRNKQTGSKEFWLHRGRALSLLNKSLSELDHGITDAIICTVGMLAYTDTHCEETKTATQLHLAALRKLIQLRGGLDRFELCGMILRLTIWCDVSNSIRAKNSTPENLEPTPNVYFESKKPIVDFKSPDFLLREGEAVMSPPHIFQDLIRFSKINHQLSLDANDITAKLELKRLTDDNLRYACGYSVQRPVIATSKHNNTTGHLNTEVMNRIVQLSKILFSYAAFPSMSIAGAFSRFIAHALRLHLQADLKTVNNHPVWQPELLCWILVTGATAVQEPRDRNWFLARLGEFVAAEKIGSFDELVVILKRVIWVDGSFGYTCRIIWAQLLKQRKIE